jgi:tetratricopeptide (TPR) repeat protein
MTAEVAYGSLLKSQRREIHRRVAELYERLAPDRLDEWAPILVHHFEKGGIGDKAYVYAVRSARRAWKTHAGREAAVYYAKALDAAGEHAASGDAAGTLDPTPAEVYEELGDVYYQTGEYRLAIEQYDRALGPCAVSRRCVTLLRKKGQACEKWGKYEDARTQFEAALGQMRKPLDPAEAAHIYSGLGMSSYHRGNLEEARQLGEIALEMMEAIENERGVAHASNNLGVIHFRKKNFPKAEELYRKSLAICESLSDPVGSATAYNNLGLVALGGNDPAEAVRRFEKARELFERMGNRQGLARAYDNLSQAFLDQGLKDEAVEYMKKAVGILAAISEEAAEVVPEMWQSGAL